MSLTSQPTDRLKFRYSRVLLHKLRTRYVRLQEGISRPLLTPLQRHLDRLGDVVLSQHGGRLVLAVVFHQRGVVVVGVVQGPAAQHLLIRLRTGRRTRQVELTSLGGVDASQIITCQWLG